MQSSDYSRRPGRQLAVNRGLLKYILLSFITLGIYSIAFFYFAGDDVNTIASRYDGNTTINYLVLVLPPMLLPVFTGILFVFPGVMPITYIVSAAFTVALFVWMHRVSNRIGGELERRGLGYEFSAIHYWLWYVLGALIVVGPFVYIYKLCAAMNMLAEDYNANG
ncbi:MAG: DUF4234 domain-containing protein [Defluviitaleaceae bacterium]|nr:DUF4234 domain-containing protein [Defluviitaleaceae bacterium]